MMVSDPGSFIRPLLVVIAVVFIGAAAAQAPSALASALAGLSSSEPSVRIQGWLELAALSDPTAGPTELTVQGVLAHHPEQADQIKTALIGALNQDAAYVRALEASNQHMTEAFSDYWSNLLLVVGALRDPRATNGLLAAVDTGGIAANGLADLCPSSVDSLIAESFRRGASSRKRASAVNVLGECMKRIHRMPPSGESAAKVRHAVVRAAGDPDPNVRDAGVKALFYFRSDPAVSAQLATLTATDPYLQGVESFRSRPGRLVIREDAGAVLAAPETDNDYYFVMRASGTHACSIGKGSEKPSADRYFGPEASAEAARDMLCTRIDPAQADRDLCWNAEPEDACR